MTFKDYLLEAEKAEKSVYAKHCGEDGKKAEEVDKAKDDDKNED